MENQGSVKIGLAKSRGRGTDRRNLVGGVIREQNLGVACD